VGRVPNKDMEEHPFLSKVLKSIISLVTQMHQRSYQSLALERPSIFMAARINHRRTLMSCWEMVEEPPTVIVSA